MNFHTVFQRDKRHPSQMYHPMHNTVADYWTEAFQKSEMKHDFSDDLFLNNIHLIPDPLKKNLADSLFNNELPKKTENIGQQAKKITLNDQKVPLENMSENPPKQPATTFGGIGSFFSGVINVLTSVVFRSRSPDYYDSFDVDSHQGSYSWQSARTDVQDKNGKADDRNGYDAPSNPTVSSDMNYGSRAAVTSCESKLNQVLHLLTPKETSSPVWVRKRPKKVFVEPGSVSESFEDAFSPEDFSSLPNETFVECYCPLQYHCEDVCETAAQKTKLNTAPVEENTEIVKDVSNECCLELKRDDVQWEKVQEQLENSDTQLEKDVVNLKKDDTQLEKSNLNLENIQKKDSKTTLELETTNPESPNLKEQLVSSCEDKLSKLKALLLEKRSKCRTTQSIPETRTTPPKAIPTDKKPADKRFKNPNRRCSKRTKSKVKCRIEDDLVFANEISVGTPPTAENSPSQHNVNFGDYFDEVSGRFRTASTGSDDSFQIVFNESVNTGRVRKSSDCDSEDSFIVFEDSPDCYVSNDVFDSDSDSEVSDSGRGATCKLAHMLTRTVSNLADDSLYAESEDEVDFSSVKCDVVEKTGLELEDTSLVEEKTVPETELVEEKSGLLLDDKKKLLRKSQPSKKVHFSSEPPKVHVMRVWAFAARQARAGHWERYAVDRERFKRRIADVDMALSWVLKPQHRRRVMFQRFMPWWNQLKRKELAEKKEREEEKRKEEEKQREEERMKEKAEKDNVEANRQEVDNVIQEQDVDKEEVNNQEDVNKAESIKEEVGEETASKRNCKETNKEEIETKSNIKTQDINNGNVKKTALMENEHISMNENRRLESNNNKIQNEVNEKITSDSIIQNDVVLAKKIQDLEADDINNYEIVTS